MANHNIWKVDAPKIADQTEESPRPITAHEILGSLGKRADGWTSLVPPELGQSGSHTSPRNWAGHKFLLDALQGGSAVHELTLEGTFALDAKSVLSKIEALFQVRPVYYEHGNWAGCLYYNESLMISVTTNASGTSGTVQLVTTDVEKVYLLQKLERAIIVPENPKSGFVYALARGMTGYNLIRIGSAGEPIERGNYSEDVLQDYDHIVKDLSTSSPCGRLMIFAGPPGTGKTYMVRSLLQEVPTCAFVIVPSHLVQELGSPELLPALVQTRNDGLTGALVMVIEDADKVLVERKKGDMSAISALLNLGDGILGSSLDIRVLATTNASELEMDPATRRPGRLCRYIEIGSLEPDQAEEVLFRLTGEHVPFKESASLAEIYNQARKMGWTPPPKEPKADVTKGMALQ